MYPPVDSEFFTPDGPQEAYFLVVSALVPYKRIEVAVEACQAVGAPLKVVGEGPELTRLRALAGPDTEFVGRCDDRTLRDLYRHARALILPGEEDFGLAPVEAQACGRPVVALGRGGALESVEDGLTGVLVPDPSVQSFARGLEAVRRLATPAEVLRQRAQRFSREHFDDGIRRAVEGCLASPTDSERA